MNERIQKLAKQCYETGPIGKDGWPEYSLLNEVKFAELIIRECADIAKHHVMNISTYADAEFVEEQIGKHFGVEE